MNQPVETDALQKQIKYYQMVAIGSKDLPAVTLSNTGGFADVLRELPTHAHFAFTPHCTDVHFCVFLPPFNYFHFFGLTAIIKFPVDSKHKRHWHSSNGTRS